MSAAWILVAVLYVLGVALVWVACEWQEIPSALAWPLIGAMCLAIALWEETIGGWLWRRRHRAWCAPSPTDETRGTP